MAVTGTESYTVSYTYDANNRLTMESKTQSGATTTSSYTYDNNGNLLSELDISGAAVVTHTYNGFNQLISTVAGTTTIAYAYNARGIRTARSVGGTTTEYLLDGGNVVGEVEGSTVTAVYLRGENLISNGTSCYLYNAHGDVVQLTDSTGAVTKSYDYDAFGNEKNPDDADTNPFRYCGEYFDTETGLYYLRARYYDPALGRFAQEDIHWNTANMIYGDTPRKINEREDALGLTSYSYAPQIHSILQSGNLYVYCVNAPIKYLDPSGEDLEEACYDDNPKDDLFPKGGPMPASSQGPVTGGTGGYNAGSLYNYIKSHGGNVPYGAKNNILRNKIYTNPTKNVVNFTSKIKGQAAAEADFYKLNPLNVELKQNGALVGKQSDGDYINIHPGHSVGFKPTLEIRDPISGKSIKIRY